MIWNKWLREPLTEPEEAKVFEIDDAILVHEFLKLMDTQITVTIPEIVSEPQYAFVGFEETEQEFLQLFWKLITGE